MTEKRIKREIKRRVLLKGELMSVQAADLAALLWGLNQAIHSPKIGFNHATTDVSGWMKSLAPYGVGLDSAFVEDMLYACNMLDELKQFKHPQGKTFDQMLKTLLSPVEIFDKETNSIVRKR
jgi:hypothetical protein